MPWAVTDSAVPMTEAEQQSSVTPNQTSPSSPNTAPCDPSSSLLPSPCLSNPNTYLKCRPKATDKEQRSPEGYMKTRQESVSSCTHLRAGKRLHFHCELRLHQRESSSKRSATNPPSCGTVYHSLCLGMTYGDKGKKRQKIYPGRNNTSGYQLWKVHF